MCLERELSVSHRVRPVKLKLDPSENNSKSVSDSESSANKTIVGIPTKEEANKMLNEVSHRICEIPTNQKRLSVVQRRKRRNIRREVGFQATSLELEKRIRSRIRKMPASLLQKTKRSSPQLVLLGQLLVNGDNDRVYYK